MDLCHEKRITSSTLVDKGIPLSILRKWSIIKNIGINFFKRIIKILFVRWNQYIMRNSLLYKTWMVLHTCYIVWDVSCVNMEPKPKKSIINNKNVTYILTNYQKTKLNQILSTLKDALTLTHKPKLCFLSLSTHTKCYNITPLTLLFKFLTHTKCYNIKPL